MQVKVGPTIDAGQFISNVFSLGQLDPYFIIVPEEWAPANLLFQFSPDGTNFYPIYRDGRYVAVGCTPGVAISIGSDLFPNGTFLKFVSGYLDHTVIQPQTCVFKFITS
jgi:hypothetical protein